MQIDIQKMLPLLLKGKLGEREQRLLKLTQNPDPAAMTGLLTELYETQAKTPRFDTYATLKKIIPAQTLGMIIKYFDSNNRNKR